MIDTVSFVLPVRPAAVGRQLLDLLGPFGTHDGEAVWLRPSDPRNLPRVAVGLRDVATATVEFSGAGIFRSVRLVNTTGIERPSPYAYSPISLADFRRRSARLVVTSLDHVGFDLPWFDGTHPEVLALRRALAPHCAYHRFPSGEDWDFILPATPEEIAGRLDYGTVHRPKVEVVSFDTVSVPLVQVDLAVDATFETLVGLFPEGLVDAAFRNVWVYLANPYGIDVCLVLNEPSTADWSAYFDGHRILAPA